MVDYLLTRARTLLKGDINVNTYKWPNILENHYVSQVSYTIRIRQSVAIAKDTLAQALGSMVPEECGMYRLAHINRQNMELALYNGTGNVSEEDLFSAGYYPTPFTNLYIKESL